MRSLWRGIAALVAGTAAVILVAAVLATGNSEGGLVSMAAKARSEAARWQKDAVLVEVEAQHFLEVDPAATKPLKTGAPKLVMFHFVSPGTGRGFLFAVTPTGSQTREDAQPMKPLGKPVPDKFVELAAAIDKARGRGVPPDDLVTLATLRVHADTDGGADRPVWTIQFEQDKKTAEYVSRQVDALTGALTAARDAAPQRFEPPRGGGIVEPPKPKSAPTPSPGPSDAARSTFTEAMKQMQSGNDDAAEKLLGRAIEASPGYADAFLARAELRQRLGRGEAAMADLDAAVRVSGSDAKALNARGTAYAQAGQRDAALRDFREAARRGPGSAVPPFNEGLVLKDAGDADGALAAFDRALTVNPNYAPAYMERGLLFLRLGQRAAAAAEFQTGERLRKGLRAQYASRIEASEKAAPTEPRVSSSASGSLADAVRLIVQERDRDALRPLDAVLARDATNAEAHLYRAKAYYNLRQHALALNDLSEAVRLRPGDAETHRMLGRAHAALGDPERALGDYGEAIRLDPGFAMAYVDRAGTFLRHYPNRVGSAQRDLEAAIRADPKNPYAWYNRAATYGGENALEILQGKSTYDPVPGWKASIDDLSEAIRLKPDFAAAFGSRGLLQLSWAMFEKNSGRAQTLAANGRGDIARAIELKPSLQPELAAEIDRLKDLPGTIAAVQQTFDSLRAGFLARVPAPKQDGGGGCGGYRGGTANACRAQDWMAVDRYNSGRASGSDKQRYGDY